MKRQKEDIIQNFPQALCSRRCAAGAVQQALCNSMDAAAERPRVGLQRVLKDLPVMTHTSYGH
ncbi:hypothetical protein CA267_004960 [Alteromonas pelagimontana]|uniref:Uncharacterized protein n=1 Tax=Alteromonas pelagimontana TaxID=1858656 RepID=A0A6M4MAE5_9ALTE|nr:hypothetical protein [Alteromonas pelagimontana]QJR80171.1 hypothetical protein CA267_004960 [Alteromonas pelagimontana]